MDFVFRHYLVQKRELMHVVDVEIRNISRIAKSCLDT